MKWRVHIQKRCPIAVVKKKTPKRAWTSETPIVDYFRILGCLKHVHVRDQSKTKFDEKSRKCVFLGVSDESKA